MTNYLYGGDALEACQDLPRSIKFDLVYIDPPYGVGTTMTMREKEGERRGRQTVGSGAAAYDDKLGTGDLVEMLLPRLAAIRDRMAESAAFILHLDHRAVHEAKVGADKVFGKGAFAGEIIWAPGNGSRGARGFAVTHQTLLVYSRSSKDKPNLTYNADDPELREPYADTSLAMHFKNVDENGRRYRERVINGKAYRYYADSGRRIGSVWTDISAMVANTPLRKEGTGYPTQKPERLMERIVKAFSPPGGRVGDLMCGSGTTLVAAARLGRSFVGADKSTKALEIAQKRLETAGFSFDLLAHGHGDNARAPH